MVDTGFTESLALPAAVITSLQLPFRGAADFTLAVAIQNIVWGISQAPVGMLADRFGLVVPIMLGAVCELLVAPLILSVPETAPRVLARRETAGASIEDGELRVRFAPKPEQVEKGKARR